jgi:Dolichyl-phosphate-mannose-protein mannosyltransferase
MGRTELVAATIVVAAATIVAESIVLSLLRLLTPAALLVCQGLWLAAAIALWRRRGRPRPPAFVLPSPSRIVAAARSQPVVAVLVVVVLAVLALQATLAIAVAPNEYDSLSYHLPRAAYWLQSHSALQYLPGATDDPAQVAPPNAELLIAWTMALARSDSFAQLVQWLMMLGLIATIFAATRRLGLGRAPAVFTACLFALMPEPLLQSATAQNDLAVTFLLAAALLFGATGIFDDSRGRLAIAAMAAGLAVGTKLYAVFIVPAAALVLLGAVRQVRPRRGLVLYGLGALVAAILGLGAFNYVQNVADEHSLTGYSGTPGGDFVRTGLPQTAARVGWDLLDAPGLPQPDFVSDPAETVASHLFAGVRGSSFSVPSPAIRSESNEDQSAYGLIGLLLIALIVAALVRRRAPPWQRLLALGALGYFLAYTLTIGYSPEAARYLLPAIALATPLLAPLALRPAWAIVAAALALATLPGAALHDIYKPVLETEGTKSVFGLDRLQQQTLDQDLTPLVPSIRHVNALLGAHAPLGFVQQDQLFDYVLMGEPLARRLVPYDAGDVRPGAIRRDRLRGVFIAYADQPPCVGRLCVKHTAGLRFVRLARDAFLVMPR